MLPTTEKRKGGKLLLRRGGEEGGKRRGKKGPISDQAGGAKPRLLLKHASAVGGESCDITFVFRMAVRPTTLSCPPS